MLICVAMFITHTRVLSKTVSVRTSCAQRKSRRRFGAPLMHLSDAFV